MRLAFIADADSIHSHRWIQFFAEAGHDVHWLSLVPLAFDPIPNVTFYDLTPRRRGFRGVPESILRVRRTMHVIAPDIVHVHYLGLNGVAALSCGWRPLVATAWGSDILFAGRSPLKGPLVRRMLRTAAAITCDAGHMIEAMAKLGADRDRIRLVYFGLDVQRFAPQRRDLTARAFLGLGDEPTVVSLRHLEPLYDVETLIRAIPAVLAQVPNARFVIVGKGSQREMLEALAADLAVGDATKFAGAIANTHLPTLLASMDVYVSTALSDGGLAASTSEAMACGLPAVVTAFGENGDWVQEDAGGYLFAPRDSAALAERIVTLLKDPSRRARFGAINRKVIEQRNEYRSQMGKVEAIYREVFASHVVARSSG